MEAHSRRPVWPLTLIALGLLVSFSTASRTAEPVEDSTAGGSDAFDLLEIRVLGNTVLSGNEVETAVYPFLGPGKHFQDLELARDALVDAYRRAGFGTAYVDIPEQAIGDDGIVRLNVTEGRVGRVLVTGARYFSGRQLRAALPSIAPGTVPRLPAFQAELSTLAASAPDRQVTPVLKSGRTAGELDVRLEVKDRLPLHAGVEISNNYTADTSKTRVAGSVSYDYLFGLPQSLSFQYQTSPEEPDEVRVLAATWMLREQGSRNSWAFYAVDSNSDVATLGSFNVLGAGRIFGARRMLGFSPDAAPFTGLTFGLDYKDFREDILARDTPAATTPISYLLLSATANSHHEGDRWQVNSELSFSAGLRNLFNSESEFAYKRYLTHGTFAYLRGRTSISRSLPNGFAATLRINAQLAAEPLISNEQFSLGGAESVRGYLEAEALADRGMQFSLEFMAPPLTLLHTKGTPWLTALPYVFGDFGFGETIQPLPRQDPSVHLASVGAGLHFGGQGPVSASAQLARTLLAGARTTEDRWRFLFLLGVSL